MSADIILLTINARYAHTAFGLRYLYANLPETLRDRTEILEFDLRDDPKDIVFQLIEKKPRLIGFGVYIWNVSALTQVAADCKLALPQCALVIGGPEVSFELEDQPLAEHADYIITGEADLAFAELCEQYFSGSKPQEKRWDPLPPPFEQLQSPYPYYTDEDIASRVIYVEASRGCPFQCSFCLSSLSTSLRIAPLEDFLEEIRELLHRGARKFKFVDRTFNVRLPFAQGILQFFLDALQADPALGQSLFLHFEMIPDRFDPRLCELVQQFPLGVLQFEVGIQSLDGSVSQTLSRRQDIAKIEQNIRFLKDYVHVHADLIVGLPGEDIALFGEGFDRLLAFAPHEIQVGILKRLRGTPLAKQASELGLRFSPYPPYEIVATDDMSPQDIARLRRFSKLWDRLANSGHFKRTLPLILNRGPSAFEAFLNLSDWLSERFQRGHGIALNTLMNAMIDFSQEQEISIEDVAHALWEDYQRGGRSDKPEFLRQHLKVMKVDPSLSPVTRHAGAQRQSRHQA